jgi:alpha-tubulin suppressor-like RCC1 family protein
MLNNEDRLFEFVLGMATVLMLCGIDQAAWAAKPGIAAGSQHTVALHSNGTLRAWGDDTWGQLGTGRLNQSATPIPTVGLTRVIAIAAGDSHTITLRSDGTVWAWGANGAGQLGNGNTMTRTTPAAVPGLTGVVAIAAGSSHTVALKSDGTVWAWGNNNYGQLGIGNFYPYSRATPAVVPDLSGVIAIAAGFGHTLALKSDGSVWAWGWNDFGQLGDGTRTWDPPYGRATPGIVPDLTGVIAIAAGFAHSVAFKSDGSVLAWGLNSNGQLGDGSSYDHATPAIVSSLTGVTAIAAGSAHTFALKSDGSVWAWGSNGSGELGNGSILQVYPASVPGLAGVTAIASGAFHTIALKFDGTVLTLGDNRYGQLGDGSITTQEPYGRATPTAVPGLTGVIGLAAGSNHTAVLKSDGSVLSWGNNMSSQLGDGSLQVRSVPAKVPGITSVIAVAAADLNTVALRADGTVWTWGANWKGQLGDGTFTDRTTPAVVPGLSGVVAIDAGYMYTVALKSDGSVWAWGWNNYGQLGDGTTLGFYEGRPTPSQVKGLTSVTAIAAGDYQTVALKSDGSVWAWGSIDSAEPGPPSTVPIVVPGITGVIAIASGTSHTMALKSDGSVWTWGSNSSGQLGNGSMPPYSQHDRTTKPAAVPGLAGVIAIAAGDGRSVALDAKGIVWTWGKYGLGPLAAVPDLTGVVAIDVNGHTLALKADGSVAAWGWNWWGELGDGGFAEHYSPVLVVNPSIDGYLNLNTDAPIIPPANLKLPFFLTSTGKIADTSATVVTTINFNATTIDTSAKTTSASTGTTNFKATDAGPTGSVYVTGMVPPNWLPPQTSPDKRTPFDVQSPIASDAAGFVLKQLTPAGWQLVVNGQLIPYASGVLNDLLATQMILDRIDTTNLKGAVFCLGYGTSAPEMTASGRMRAVATIPGGPASAVSCNVAASSPTTPLTGLWWNQSESGWGISLTQHSAMMFLAWYTYDAAGNPIWYVMSSCPVSNNNACSGNIYQVASGSALTVPWNGSAKAVTQAGTGSLTFYDNNRGVLNYMLNGVSGIKPITRQIFATGTTAPAVDYSDLWWNANESGWGVALTQQFGMIFVTAFTYDAKGQPIWYVASSCPVVSKGCTGPLYQVSGGVEPKGQWLSPNILATQVGTVRFSFNDSGSGMMGYTINGVSGSKAITRQLF